MNLLDLPYSLLFRLLAHYVGPTESLARVSRTCRTLHEVCNDNLMWVLHYRRSIVTRYGFVPLGCSDRDLVEGYGRLREMYGRASERSMISVIPVPSAECAGAHTISYVEPDESEPHSWQSRPHRPGAQFVLSSIDRTHDYLTMRTILALCSHHSAGFGATCAALCIAASARNAYLCGATISLSSAEDAIATCARACALFEGSDSATIVSIIEPAAAPDRLMYLELLGPLALSSMRDVGIVQRAVNILQSYGRLWEYLARGLP